MLRERYRFARDGEREGGDWADRMARNYEAQLFKEVALVDLSRAEASKSIGLRWRSQREVLSKKGEDVCGEIHCQSGVASNNTPLQAFEVPFSFVEGGERKLELVKVRLCPLCAEKLRQCAPEDKKKEEGKRKKKRKKRRKSEEEEEG